jgi:enediyne biosynthesis protein E4
MKARLSHRKQLLLITSVLSAVFLLVALVLVLRHQPTVRYDPDAPVEGVTSELDRSVPADYPHAVLAPAANSADGTPSSVSAAGSQMRPEEPGQGGVQFVEVSKAAGIDLHHFWQQRSSQLPEDMGSGAAWGDFDNDGDDDLFVVNFSGPLTMSESALQQSPATCRLYRNDGNGKFTDVTSRTGLGLKIRGMGAAWGDFDGDGWLDLVVTSYPDLFLFRSQGNGTFTDVSALAEFDKFKGFWTGVTWSDYDRDGDLDLYVCGYVKYQYTNEDAGKVSLQFKAEVPFTLNPSSYPAERNLLLLNEGRTRFTEVGGVARVDNPTGRSLSAAWCDFDEDGWPDLYVANDVSDNALFRNTGGGRFSDISHTTWVADPRGAMGLAIGDWDGDGDFDIFVTHWIAQENALFTNMRIGVRGVKPGRMVFMDIADQVGLGQISLDYVKWGTSFFDFDNDGRPDLYVVTGSTFQEEGDRRKLIASRHMLFWNKGEMDGFYEVSPVSGTIFRQKSVGRGAAFSDYDNDGDVDVFVVNHAGPAWLLRNDGGNRQNWLKVKVRERKNRFGVGALIKVKVGKNFQMQEIGSQPSYLSQNSLTAHFGAGTAGLIDQVSVAFTSGKKVELQAVKPNQTLVVEEPF